MNKILLLRKLSGIIGCMKPMDFFFSQFLPVFFFHLDGLTTPNKVYWSKLETLFAVQDEITAHQLENVLFSLSPSSFESIEWLFSKFKSLFIFLKQCETEKKEDELIFQSFQNWVMNTQFLCQRFLLLGALFQIGKCLL